MAQEILDQTAKRLIAALEAVVPYALSRAEDLVAQKAAGNEDPTCPGADAACAAASALLAELSTLLAAEIKL